MITQAELKAILDYEPTTGLFFWKVALASHIKIGEEAGHVSADGYVTIRINGTLHYGHRLAWLYVHGVWVEFIDHDDTIRSNNRIRNLRPATRKENNRNGGMRKNNTTGFKGVFQINGRAGWHARITVDRKGKYLGAFDCPKQAAIAYDTAALLHHGAFAKTNQALGLLP